MMKLNYRRHLPHIQPPGCIMFVTFRVAGSLPAHVEEELVKQSQLLRQNYRSAPPNCPEMILSWKKLFKYADDNLDTSGLACYLTDPKIANIVVKSVHHGETLGQYRLHRYCIMSNHVHMLIEPMPMHYIHDETMGNGQWPPHFYTEDGKAKLCGQRRPETIAWRSCAEIMKSLKGSSARQINKVINTAGVFWSQESFDHWIRNGEEYVRVVDYIDNNPVKARQCKAAEDWRWSSAGEAAWVAK